MVNVVSFSELAPVLAAVLGPMLAFVVVSMRYQHLDAIKTRELISASEKETRRLLGAELAEIRSDLSDARERLARIEGRFGIGAPLSRDEANESDEGAAGGE